MTTETPMQLGMVGLGRMGANLVRRLMQDGHECVVNDVSADAIAELVAEGAIGAPSLTDFIAKLEAPRTVWVMVPAGDITQKVTQALADVLEPGDTVIDGGNSYYRDDLAHAALLKSKGIHHVDVGDQQQAEVGGVGQQCLMDQRVVRQWAVRAHPGLVGRRARLGREHVQRLDRPDVDRTRLIDHGPGRFWQAIAQRQAGFMFVLQAFRRQCHWHLALMIDAGLAAVKGGRHVEDR